ncbi:MAG: hypothetical protein PVG06_08815 [Desulfobacterales bacterium]|jgi:hypothetical protein
MNSNHGDKKSKARPERNDKFPRLIEDFIKDFTRKGISTISNSSKDEQTIIVNWAQDVVDQYGSILKEYPMKIKSLVDLPYPKENIKIAIKTLLPAYLAKGSDDIINLLKDRYVRLSAFQEISQEDKETIIKEADKIDQKLESTETSIFRTYQKYMGLIISEQNILLEDIDTFINDLQIQKTNS